MGGIKHLPEAVHSSVRSGIILFDFARVVEELIFNSLDAGATKIFVFQISVAVGVGTCYVKVVDNGVGITRDGLVLLGERYATSKFDQLTETNAVTRSFGFRGEALSSISDVSLLEVITKAHGRPNGYRKVVKGCKCLYLEIDDGRQDVGTTVIVRDLFYNQPVRRRHIKSSTKKVLQSVKNCALRIALIHPKVLFKVVDTESDDVLFSTAPSSSTLSLLTSGFGIELSSSLHELSVSDGVLKLLGYMSTPCDTSSAKVFQYVYINSRYICKGPIHKLLNQLATRFNYLDQQQDKIGTHNAKRSRSQTSATYILNLICPRSWYDITFEPSNTSVEFKDWFPLIGFIEKSVTRFWSEKLSYGYSLGHVSEEDNVRRDTDKTLSLEEDLPMKYEIPKRRREMQPEESDIMYYPKGNRFTHCNASEFEEQQTGLGFDCEVDFSFQSCDGSQAPDTNVFSTKDHFMQNEIFAAEKSKDNTDFILDYSLENGHLNMAGDKSNGYTGSALSFDSSEICNEVDNFSNYFTKPFLRHCSTWKTPDRESLVSSEGFDFQMDGFRTKRKRLERNLVDVGEMDDIDQRFAFGQRNQWLDEVADVSHFGSSDRPFDSEHSPVMSDSSFLTKSLGVEKFFGENALESCVKYDIGSRYDTLEDWEIRDHSFRFNDTIQNSSTHGNCSPSRWTNMCSDSKSCESFSGDSLGICQQHKPYDAVYPEDLDVLSDDREWLCLDSHGKHNGNLHATSRRFSSAINRDKVENQKDQLTYHEKEYVCKKRPRRSHSAPPFYRDKKKFIALNDHLVMSDGKTKIHPASDDVPTSEETTELMYSQRSAGVCKLHSEPSSVEDQLIYTRPEKKAVDMSDFQDFTMEKKSEDHIDSMNSGEDIQDPSDSGIKWRKCCPSTAQHAGKLRCAHNEDTVLDVSSGILHLAGDSLVPESINKNFLVDAQVLQQVDKKFIPVVGSGVLAIIDQHAADERIRLEELRQKVLSEGKKTVTYLDSEQKLVLPEIEYQLLHTYAEQIQSWGWLCNIHARGSKSFKKNLNLLRKQPTVVTLVAVPCILGVNLTDVDLLEFLQQLAETDGSSTIPPSVHRVLNFKACRGAIMFGDTLLPSECSLIVEELKQTSLCFQCAHGRPTTVPLVNLEALHKQIAKLGSWSGGSNGSWHGLRQHQLSLERASHRLSSAIGNG
ncbi:DNA mismatch repair protein MLH3 isoform X1 [Rhododendron vialii]|uniref:DNA mismatch repair protein MLH3 isoform X1 n=1 Tax=Rhododendron vialii TaxID=182163 RepID=UPI00266003F2|nr:DNA mismatch repair protein MLH3 isoform X1 [Rhododendron vialii]XP_058187201.1 DNA mismatch repair protein MLH3 isoform X1 [Rhododendron vialii]